MIRRIDLRGSSDQVQPGARTDYRSVVPRADTDVAGTLEVVRPIVDAVRQRGVEAVLELSEKFDGVRPDDTAVPPEALAEALRELDPAVRAALEESIKRLRMTCEAELESDVVSDVVPG